MPTRNINLTDHLDAFVEEAVTSGHYSNASEVMRDALRLLQQRRKEDAEKLERLREAVTAGFAEIEAGNYIEFDADDAERVIGEISEQSAPKVRRKAS